MSLCQEIKHFDGGPMNRDAPLGIVHVLEAGGESAAEWARRDEKLQAVSPGWVVGAFENVEAAVRARASAATGGKITSNQEIYDRTFFSEIDCL